MDKQVIKLQYAVSLQDWSKVIVIADQLLANDPENIEAAYHKLYAIVNIDDIAQRDQEAKQADRLLSLTNMMFWPFLSEHILPRTARRFAFHVKAWRAFENAKSTDDLQQALEYIDAALDVNYSPLDTESLLEYRETRVRILLALGDTEKAYGQIYLILLKNKGYDGFDDITVSDAYKAFAATAEKQIKTD